MSLTKTVTVYSESGEAAGYEEEEHELPAKHVVCSRCEGYGTHLHPAIGQHAYSQEEFAESFPDDEDREAYFARGGKYDVACEECKGARVVVEIDESACTPAQRAILEQFQRQDAERAWSESEDRRTMARESGCWDC